MKTRFQHLEVAVAVAGADPALRARTVRLAAIEEDLGTRAAGADFAHGPEVVLLAAPDDPVRGQADHLPPDPPRLVVSSYTVA